MCPLRVNNIELGTVSYHSMPLCSTEAEADSNQLILILVVFVYGVEQKSFSVS